MKGSARRPRAQRCLRRPAAQRCLRRRGAVVDHHGHAGRHLEREHGQPGRVVEVDARPGGRRRLVVRARAPELAVPDHDSARLQHRALVPGGDRPAGVVGLIPGDALGDELLGPGGHGRGQEVMGPLAADAVVTGAEAGHVRHVVRQVGQLVKHAVGPEGGDRLRQRLGVEDVADHGLRPEVAEQSGLLRGPRHARHLVPGRDQQRDQADADQAARAGHEDAHGSELSTTGTRQPRDRRRRREPPAAREQARSGLRLGDVDQPGDAELVDAHAELVAPDLLGQGHRDGAADGELLEVLAQDGVVAGQADREAGRRLVFHVAGVSATMIV